MKRIVVTVLFTVLFLMTCCAYASGGELTFKTDSGFTVFSEGVEECDGFGFAISDGVRTIHLYMVGAVHSEPFSAKLVGLSDRETEICVFTVTDGVFTYGKPYYVTDRTEIETLDMIKSKLINELKTVVDKSLYREAEVQQIEQITSDAEEAIQNSIRRYSADEALLSAKKELLNLKTDEQLKAEEFAAIKASAIAEVSGFVDKSLYRPEEQTAIEAIVSLASEQINNAEELSDIDAVVSEAKTSLASLKTHAQYEAEELAQLKQQLVSELGTIVNPDSYRESERLEIERIVSSASEVIQSGTSKSQVTSVFENAKAELLLLKTDAEYKAEELNNAKASAISRISSYIDKSLYREAEQLKIDGIIEENATLINSRTDVSDVESDAQNAIAALDNILTSAELKKNADENTEVLYYLDKAVKELEDTRFVGKEKDLMKLVIPVMKTVIADGTYGSIVITPEQIKSDYPSEVAGAKGIYNSMSEDVERPVFEQKLAQLDMETQAFLREYFL